MEKASRRVASRHRHHLQRSSAAITVGRYPNLLFSFSSFLRSPLPRATTSTKAYSCRRRTEEKELIINGEPRNTFPTLRCLTASPACPRAAACGRGRRARGRAENRGTPSPASAPSFAPRPMKAPRPMNAGAAARYFCLDSNGRRHVSLPGFPSQSPPVTSSLGPNLDIPWRKRAGNGRVGPPATWTLLERTRLPEWATPCGSGRARSRL
ncbi:hypothetical protein BHE74_00004712 [Ensete ventricosum]|nr:hypothetical protein BHE74_00004712 [Ensete ventricosum]